MLHRLKDTDESHVETKGSSRLFRRRAEYQRSAQYAYVQTKLQLLGIIGLFGFPAYWVVWTQLYPQPYENLTLRLLGAAAAIPFIVERWLPSRLKALMPTYGFVFCTLALPGFFTFMSLMNGANMVWQTSLIASFLYLALILDALYFILSVVAGMGFGLGVYLLTSSLPVPDAFLDAWPIYLFALSAGGIFNYAEALNRAEDRIRAARAVGGTIAHEMRTPLLGIRLDAGGGGERLDGLLRDDPALTAAMRAEGEALAAAFRRIESHSLYAETALNLMLANLAGPRPAEIFEDLRMADLVAAALDRFPFRGLERAKVSVDVRQDFTVRAAPILLTQVIHNLLRNALRAVAEARHGEIRIRLERGRLESRLIVHDTGLGIPAHRLRDLFQPFTTMWAGSKGVGLGLSFCKKAVEDMGGRITVTSRSGTFTQFTIRFPALPD